jgi:lipopolysaccharide biosynthesis glycosyltransferase
MQKTVYVGYDSRMPNAYMVAVRSLLNHSTADITIKPLLLHHLRATEHYNRPTIGQTGAMRDVISNAPMATEFAITRFCIPHLENYKGISLFCDSDFLFRTDIAELFAMFDERYAIQCVKHDHKPQHGMKMDGQVQTTYGRKNWSSCMLINNAHPANRFLDLEAINTLPGRDLHQFKWLEDDMIGELPVAWNWLVGHSDVAVEPKAVHFTDGTPDMEGYRQVPYADEWREVLRECYAGR